MQGDDESVEVHIYMEDVSNKFDNLLNEFDIFGNLADWFDYTII